MKDKLKIKKEYVSLIRELTDKQAGELIKGLCAYAYEDKPFVTKDGYLKGIFLYIKRDIDVAKQNSLNGRKGAEKLAERKRKKAAVNELGVLIGSIAVAADKGKKKVE